MSKRQIKMPYTSISVDAKVNPASVKKIVEQFIEEYPSGLGFDRRSAFSLLEKKSYKVELTNTDKLPYVFSSSSYLVRKK